MRIFFDTEFLDLGETVQLVSLGAVRDDGKEFYAEADEVDWSRADPWVLDHVVPHLTGPRIPKLHLRHAFLEFAHDATEFWAWYGTYDWFLVCRLFGGFRELPVNWPHYFHDLETLRLLRGARRMQLPEQKGQAHHALEDARWNQAVYDWLRMQGAEVRKVML